MRNRGTERDRYVENERDQQANSECFVISYMYLCLYSKCLLVLLMYIHHSFAVPNLTNQLYKLTQEAET